MGALHILIHLDDCSQIATAIAIVWSWEDSRNMAIMGVLISVVHQLVGSCDLFQPVGMIEFHWIILTKCPSGSSWTHVKAEPFIGVTPKQVTNRPFTGNLLDSVEFSNIVECFDIRRKASMGSKDLSFDYGCERQVVKELCQHLPDIVILVLSHALIVKSIILSDASWFVVSSQDGQALFIANFETQ